MSCGRSKLGKSSVRVTCEPGMMRRRYIADHSRLASRRAKWSFTTACPRGERRLQPGKFSIFSKMPRTRFIPAAVAPPSQGRLVIHTTEPDGI